MSKRSAGADSRVETKSKKAKASAPLDNSSDMTSSTATKRILVIGLAGHSPGSAMSRTPKPKGQFRKMLQKTVADARDAGMELDVMQVKVSAFPSGLKDIKERLSSKPYGVVIGNGIRGTAEYTVFFEDVVNACCEITPETKFGFNTSPDDILECCLRNFK